MDVFEKAWRAIKKARLDDVLNANTNCNCAIISDDGNIQIVQSQACHGGLSGQSASSFRRRYVISSIQKVGYGALKLDQCKEYVDWLVKDSFWSKCFVGPKSAEDVFKLGYFVTDCRTPANLMVGALMSTRRLWEYCSIPVLTSLLIRKGINPEVAYLSSLLFYCNSEGVVTKKVLNSSHLPVYVEDFNKESVARFLKKEPNNLKSNYSQTVNYIGVTSMFGANEGERGFLTGYVKKAVIREVNKESKSPFAMAKVSDKDYSYTLEDFHKWVERDFQPMLLGLLE